MYKIAICEDDKEYIDVLKNLILSTNVVDSKMLHFSDFISGEQLIYEQKIDFDLIIMDIQLAQMDGYETAMSLRKIDSKFLLVFCSGVYMPVPKFFKANAFRYLDKSDSQVAMRNEMIAIMQEMVARKEQPYIMCKLGRGKDQIRVYAEDILFIGKRSGGSAIFPYGRLAKEYQLETLRSSINLNELEKKFDEAHNFIRLHNSYIVNMTYIMKVTKESVELAGGKILTISRSKSKNFSEKFAKYVSSKYEG